MAVDEKWYFTKEQLLQSPSRKSGYDVDKELSCRQQAANFIQDMGQRLQVSQLCINTAIVYMHRFYVFHSLAAFHRNAIAAAALFLAAKVEEQPRKLEHVIKVAHMCLHRESPNLDTKSELYLEQAQDLVFNENVLLQTLGFDVAIDHPHTHVVRCCQLVRASKDLAQTSYFMASNSLHLTTMCLQYKPTVVACFCIHLACKWSNWEIPRSNEGKDWFWYIDKTVTIDLLEQLTGEFLAILNKCPTKLKRKMMSMNQNNTPGFTQQTVPQDGLQFEEPRKLSGAEAIKPPEGLFPLQKSSSNEKAGTSTSTAPPPPHAHHQKIDYREYREKKERERMEREKQQQQQTRDSHNVSSSNHHHHSKPSVMSSKSHSTLQLRTSSSSGSHKSYQQPPHGIQQNMHFQGVKENRESSSQGFQSSSSTKDSNYLKQHPPHTERDGSKDGVSFHGQYSQNSNLQHQGYPHKPESNYSGNYSHREGGRGSHGVQGSGSSNLSQAHHVPNQNVINNSNLMNSQRESLIGTQRESQGAKDSESQSQVKDSMSSSIRDIISQSVSQKDLHSMTNERKEHVRDKSRMNYMHGSATATNFRPEPVKPGREHVGLNFHESVDRKADDFGSKLKDKFLKKGEEEPVIETIKSEPTPIKSEKFDETDVGDENSTWNFGIGLSNVKNEKSNFSCSIKTEPGTVKNEVGVDFNKTDSFSSNTDSVISNKSQSAHPMKMYDSKFKGHHYHSSSKSSDIPQIKSEKAGVQCSSELNKKMGERAHEKHRKPQEPERSSLMLEGSGNLSDMPKHHKLNKDMSDKHKLLIPGSHTDQRIKDKLSPSKYQKMKTVPRPSNLGYMKSESGHFSFDANSSNNTNENESIEALSQPLMSLKPIGVEETNKSTGNLSNFQKQKNHEFGGSGSTVPDTNFTKSGKTSSIFSPDSKIPPQNILNSLEKDSKKSSSISHRNPPPNKTPPNSTMVSSKKTVPSTVLGPISTSTTSTTGSLFSPPLPKNIPSIAPRHRTSSSGSEPELIPVLTKLEETPGYENIIREKKIALTPTKSPSPNVEREKKLAVSNEKSESSNSFGFEYDHRLNSKDSNKSNDVKPNVLKSDVVTQPVTSKAVTNVKLPNEIRSDLGAVIYPTNPKSIPVSKSNQGITLSDSKLSLANSVSTVNLLGIEKMVDTSISPAKPINQFGSSTAKLNATSNSNFNQSASCINVFGSSTATAKEQTVVDQSSSKANSVTCNQDTADVDILGYCEKKRSEKKKKKEKHKHKEKDKDKSERKKEKKKHKDKDKEKVKEKDKHKDKEKYKEKEKHREKEIDVVSSETPIKITIPKDKISGSLKIKISKDCLKKEDADSLKSNTSGDLKIKISKDVFSNIGTYKEESKSDSKKRERSPKSSSDLPHSKSMKTSDKRSSSLTVKSNGTEGSSRNSSSHKYSVSENGSYFDISSFCDFPFDFEENGQGIIKTPDYDFEALDASEFTQGSNTSPEKKEVEENDKNSHNESVLTKDNDAVATREPEASATFSKEPECCDVDVSCSDMTADVILKPISPLIDINSPERLLGNEGESIPESDKPPLSSEINVDITKDKHSPEMKPEDTKKDKMISLENCDVLKNYKTILDSHSRRCQSEILKHSVSPVSPEESTIETNNSDDNNNKNETDANKSVASSDKNSVKASKNSSDTENPNYYNKYFKKDGGSRIRARDDKRTVKGRPDEKLRFDDRRYYDSRRYRTDYVERDRRYYRDYNKEPSQYYYERKDERRFDYPDYKTNQYFTPVKAETTVPGMNYDVNANGTPVVFQGCPQAKTTPQFPQLCKPVMPGNPPEMNVQYQFGYYNNYMYANGGYRFYGNLPFVNMSLLQQQPMPPGTGDTIVQIEPPPLPLEPPPDLPPPPETPPPPPK